MTFINTNIGAITAQSTMSKVNSDFETAMTRLSSGLRINAAKDDAAGMAIAEKMTSQIMDLDQAVRNATDSKNLLDTTEGAHQEISNMLQRLRELSVQSANDTNTSFDRSQLTAEATQLVTEINRVASDTTFNGMNGMNVIDGSFTGKQFQIGADAGQVMNIDVDSAAATAIGAHTLDTTVSVIEGADTGIAASTTVAISGPEGAASVNTTAGMSAKDLAAAINNVAVSTGVEATAVTNAKLSNLSGIDSFSMDLNGVSIGQVNISDTNDLSSLRDAINNQTGRTGVTATLGSTGGEIILTSNSGEDILIGGYDGTASIDVESLDKNLAVSGTANKVTMDSDATPAVTTAAISGQVSMTSTKAFSVTDSVAATDGTTFFEASPNLSDLNSVAEIDLSTAKGASAAIDIIDVAISKITEARAELGAVSNRLDSTISNLSNISVNVEAARSNVMDADFAKESTALARGQILSQAATAMLAQANSSKQGVLSLLKG